MLTTLGRSGHHALPFVLLSAIMLAACTARPVLHEFPPALAPDARPESAVSYTLREREAGSGDWVLRGGQGDVVGGFRWQQAFRDADAAGGAPDRAEDFRRDDLFQDGINKMNYRFRLSATSTSLKNSAGWGTAPPRVTIFDAADGKRVGELELRIGYETGFEGDWKGRQVLWGAAAVPAAQVERDSDSGRVEDHYPAAQLLQWTGGSDAGLKVWSGRVVQGEPLAFAELLFDIDAGRPLTRRELGDAITLLFAIRAVEQAAVGAKAPANAGQ